MALLNSLKHKYVIKMLDHFEDQDSFYIIMERPEKYIDLFDYISGKRVMSERSARYLFRQVWKKIYFSHAFTYNINKPGTGAIFRSYNIIIHVQKM